MYPSREVFAASPLEYAAAELRYPYSPRARQRDVLDAIFADLQDVVPILRPMPQLTLGPMGTVAAGAQIDQVNRAFNRSSTIGLNITPNALTLDTTTYSDFGKFRELVRRCVLALDKHAPPVALERVGLRYINEIRVPGAIQQVHDWQQWVCPDLVGAAALVPEYETVSLQGALQYKTGPDRQLVFRFTSAQEGALISDEPLKRRHKAPQGPFFGLDLDSFWEPSAETSPPWSEDTILEILDTLHSPAGTVFQSVLTEKLKKEVLRVTHDS